MEIKKTTENNWVSVHKSLPNTWRPVLVCFNHGSTVLSTARYISKFTTSWDPYFKGALSDYDKLSGDSYVKDGWWGRTMRDGNWRMFSDTITHWRELPLPPSELNL